MNEEQIRCLLNAITNSIQEMERCPDDDIPSIWNEMLRSWEVPLRMTHDFRLESIF